MTHDMFTRFRERLASQMLRFPAKTPDLDEFFLFRQPGPDGAERVPDHKAFELCRHLLESFTEYPGLAEIERVTKAFLGLGRPELQPVDFGPAPPPVHCKTCGDWGQVRDEQGFHYWCPEGCRAAFELRKAQPDILESFNQNHERCSNLIQLQRVQAAKLAKQREQARREVEVKRAAAAKDPPADSGAA